MKRTVTITLNDEHLRLIRALCTDVQSKFIYLDMKMSKTRYSQIVTALYFMLGVTSRRGVMLWAIENKIVKLGELK